MPTFRCLCLLLALTFLAAPVWSQAIDLYEGEAPVSSQAESERVAALPAAMAQMLIRLTGDPDIALEPTARALMDDAPRLMQRFRYRQQNVVRDGLPQMRTWLVARFDPEQVDAALSRANVAVWLEPRPQPLVWLVIDDGSGPRLLGAAQAAVVAGLNQQAAQRGFGLRFPGADAAESELVGSIMAGRVDPLREASERYSSSVLLIGRLLRDGSGWRAHWTAVEGGEVLDTRSASGAHSGELLMLGADMLADALAGRHRMVSGGEAQQLNVRLTGLSPPADYARVLVYLQRMPGVQSVRPLQASGDALQLELVIAGGLNQLERLVEQGGVLQVAGSGSGEFSLRR